MTDEKECKCGTDWGNVIGALALFALIVLFAGSPDLMDAIVSRVRGDA